MPGNSCYAGVLHCIERKNSQSPQHHKLAVFEYSAPDAPSDSTVVFLGGLFDGLGTVPYVPPLATNLPPGWHLVEPILSSSYRQWGISALNDDVLEIADLILHFRKSNGKIVLLGHSTGCQMIMHYLLTSQLGGEIGLPNVDGAIMQGSCSDREALNLLTTHASYDEVCKVCKEYIDAGKADEVLPQHFSKAIFGSSTPITARRMFSIASPPPDHAGEDDYFSSDLDESRLDSTFGRLGKSEARLAFLFGERDEFVPPHIRKAEMVGSWEQHIRNGGGNVDQSSGILANASHTLKEGGISVDGLIGKVTGFLRRVRLLNQ